MSDPTVKEGEVALQKVGGSSVPWCSSATVSGPLPGTSEAESREGAAGLCVHLCL